MKMYMHTLHGRPAFFYAGDGHIYIAGGRYRVTLCTSLRQIRRQQDIAIASRRAEGFEASETEYGYAPVEVPDAPRR